MNEIEWSMSTAPNGPQHHAEHRGLVFHVYGTGPATDLHWEWVVLNNSGVIAGGEAGTSDEAKAAAEKWVRALAPLTLASAAAPTPAREEAWGKDFDLTTRDGCAAAIREVLSEAIRLLPRADGSEARARIGTSNGIADSLASLASLLPDQTTRDAIGRLQRERDAATDRAEREQRTRAMVHADHQRVSEIIQDQLGVPTRDGLSGGLRGLVARVKAGSGTFDRDDAIQFFAYLERVTKALEQVDTILNPPF